MTELGRKFYSFLEKNNSFIRKSNGWFGIKCPFCGDSRKDRSPHLFIRIKDDDVFAMKCYRVDCDVSRIISVKDAMRLGITDKDVLAHLNNKFINQSKIEAIIKNDVVLSNNIIPVVADYFKARTNIELTHDSLKMYTIVTDFEDFYNLNKSKVPIRIRYIKNAIGFINVSGTLMYVRYIDGNSKKHEKISLVDKYILNHKPYVIDTRKNIDKDRDFYMCYNEGVFDAVNVSKHIVTAEGIFTASFGEKAMYGCINDFSKHYRNVTTIINKDGDVNKSKIENYIRHNSYRFNDKAYIIGSKNTNDMGDMREQFVPYREEIIINRY